MKRLVHNIMGTSYEVLFSENKEEIGMSEENSGECRVFSKKILVCTERGDCTDEELSIKVQEIIAHEIFHAYVNEAGLDVEPEVEEMFATFFMKNWRKMNYSILDFLDESGFLDK